MDDTQNTNAIKAREIGLQINALTEARKAITARIKTGEFKELAGTHSSKTRAQQTVADAAQQIKSLKKLQKSLQLMS